MKDEEVGELWQLHVASQLEKFSHGVPDYGIAGLIRKLVEERARNYLQWHKDVEFSKGREMYFHEIKYALRDFHIDPATWPEEWR